MLAAMWPELIEDIQLELKLLHELLDQTAPLRRAAAGQAAVGLTEKLAAAGVLQCFYNGIENVLDMLAERADGRRPTGRERFALLLDQLSRPLADRPAVISGPLRDGLRQYLEFRNSYRYGHYFRLNWPLASALLARCGETLERFEAELDQFIRHHAGMRFLG
ncbi:MAG: hypothetical protein J7M21_01000, partial [Planctomycetes bacterium]|nr:hypothetical protein [Planctomycetota bacterium]